MTIEVLAASVAFSSLCLIASYWLNRDGGLT
jgi:hypothetical protein